MKRFSARGLPKHITPFTIPFVAESPPPPVPITPRHIQQQTRTPWAAELIRLGHIIGSAGLHNHHRGRWFRITRFQAETVAACIVYVILCLIVGIIRAGVITIHWLRGF